MLIEKKSEKKIGPKKSAPKIEKSKISIFGAEKNFGPIFFSDFFSIKIFALKKILIRIFFI